MNKPETHFSLVVTAAIFCLLTIQSVQAKEPYYDGKPLSQWLCCEPLEDAQNAVQQIGTNAIPTLLDMVGITEKTARRVASHLDSKTIQSNVRSEDFRIDDLQDVAVRRGFAVLGTNAESAIPKLTKLLEGEETSSRAAEALAVIGPKGFATLTNYLAVGKMRGSVIVALGEDGGGDPKVVTQILISVLKDEDPGTRANAADFLARRDPDLAIPALIQVLDDKDTDVRRWAVVSLGSYGAAAKGAAPKFLSLYTNAPDVITFDSLQKIDVEATGKAEQFILDSGPLNAKRFGYTKTLLKNGKELIAGGWLSASIVDINNRCLSKSELRDPATGKWTETGEMNVARHMHAAILLANGNVLVAGGSNRGGDLKSAELYDPDTGKWSMTGSLNKVRNAPHANLESNGMVLIYSEQYQGPIFNVEQYDPTTKTWSVITNLTSIPK
ncbi:MAG TPA: HEAT repeat domain-containing protein [Candidatus Acidoferrales bacterium]|jgi:HEAT repeat protein|nr:HEAT repeat domain-containing protein [Candidatus Acidoferrales bacterium]